MDSNEVTGVVVRNNLVSDNLTFQIDIGSRAPVDQIEVDHNLIDAFRGSEAEVRGQDFDRRQSPVRGCGCWRFSSYTRFPCR